MSLAGAARYCGDAARWEEGACVVRACASAEVRDEVTGECLGGRALRAIGELQHVAMDDDHVLGCRKGGQLRVASGHARCVEPNVATPIPRDRCPAGAVYDPRMRSCVAVMAADGDSVFTDVAAWAQAVVGPDGGPGSAAFCSRAVLAPAAFGILSGAESSVDVQIDVVFPSNDVTLVFARVRTGRTLPAAADLLLQRAVAREVDVLRALGGTSRTASLSLRVRCPVRGGSIPIATTKEQM